MFNSNTKKTDLQMLLMGGRPGKNVKTVSKAADGEFSKMMEKLEKRTAERQKRAKTDGKQSKKAS